VREALRDGYDDLRKTVAEGTETLAEAQTAAETVPSAIVALFDGLLIQLLLEPEREVRPGELIAALGSLFGTALAEASSRRVRPASLAEGVLGLGDQADSSEDDAGGDRTSRGRGRRARSARGAIYRLKPARGSRRQTPPLYVVLIQAGRLSRLRTALVAPVSTRAPTTAFRPEIELDGEPARVLVERLRAVDRKRLEQRVGRLSAREQDAVDQAIAAVLALR
jgi:mRNA-degrading endonuclease toxin of MazEF toxin-antitoxin module